MGIKITDLVDQQAMQQLADLGTRFDDIKAKYVQIANELINGINIKVTVIGDLEKLDNLVRTQSRQLIDTSKQLTAAVEEEQQVLKRTTATIAEQLQKNAQYNAKKRENINIDKEAMQIGALSKIVAVEGFGQGLHYVVGKDDVVHLGSGADTHSVEIVAFRGAGHAVGGKDKVFAVEYGVNFVAGGVDNVAEIDRL